MQNHNFSGLDLQSLQTVPVNPAACADLPRMSTFKAFLETQRNSWTDTPVDLALVGKNPEDSAFLLSTIPVIEPVGSTDGEDGVAKYAFKTQRNVGMWDLGATLGGKVKKHEKTLKKCDVICVIVTDLGEDEIQLIEYLKKEDINYSVVYLEQESEAESDKKSGIVAKIKEQVKRVLRLPSDDNDSDANTTPDRHVLVLPRTAIAGQIMLASLLKNLPPAKYEALLLASPAWSPELIASKKSLLKERMWMASLQSSIIPPGESSSTVSCDMEVLIQEIAFLARELGLDPESLEQLAMHSKQNVSHLRRHCKPWVLILMSQVDADTVSRLFQILGSTGLRLAAAMGANVENRFPSVDVLFPHMVFPISFGTTFYMLNKLIDLLAKEAHGVIQAAFGALRREEGDGDATGVNAILGEGAEAKNESTYANGDWSRANKDSDAANVGNSGAIITGSIANEGDLEKVNNENTKVNGESTTNGESPTNGDAKDHNTRNNGESKSANAGNSAGNDVNNDVQEEQKSKKTKGKPKSKQGKNENKDKTKA